jgi:hypothetical protein
MADLSTETVGEGMAFFRWHWRLWPYECTCRQDADHFCVRLWRTNDRSTCDVIELDAIQVTTT